MSIGCIEEIRQFTRGFLGKHIAIVGVALSRAAIPATNEAPYADTKAQSAMEEGGKVTAVPLEKPEVLLAETPMKVTASTRARNRSVSML